MSQYLDKDGASRIAENFLSKQAEQDAILKNLQFDLKEAEHALVKTIQGPAPLNIRALTRPLDDYIVSGNTIQDGAPSPDYPVDVVGCGERTENLLRSFTVGYAIAENGTIYENSAFMYFTSPCQANETYTFSLDSGLSDSMIRVHAFNGDTWIEQTLALRIQYAPLTFTTPENTTNLKISIIKKVLQKNCMLNLGSTALPYEPYGYKLPLTIGGTEYPIYLGQVPTTRRIKKHTFTGEEIVSNCVATTDGQNYCVVFRYDDIGMNDIINYEETMADISYPQHFSSHFVDKTDNYSNYRAISNGQIGANDYGSTGKAKNRYIIFCVAGLTTAADYSAWFAQQYAAGTPVVVWYVLAEPETAVVNEPLHKIGDYADTISMAQAGVEVSTTKGFNIITTDTTVLPSNIEVKGVINNA